MELGAHIVSFLWAEGELLAVMERSRSNHTELGNQSTDAGRHGAVCAARHRGQAEMAARRMRLSVSMPAGNPSRRRRQSWLAYRALVNIWLKQETGALGAEWLLWIGSVFTLVAGLLRVVV